MKGYLRSGVLSLAVIGAMLVAESTAQAQRRGGPGRGRPAARARVDVNRGAVYRNRGGNWYGRNYYNRYGRNYYNRFYPGYRYPYGYRTYYNRYYGSYPRSSYYVSSPRYHYYTSNGWRICYDRYTGLYWYLSGGVWYRWY